MSRFILLCLVLVGCGAAPGGAESALLKTDPPIVQTGGAAPVAAPQVAAGAGGTSVAIVGGSGGAQSVTSAGAGGATVAPVITGGTAGVPPIAVAPADGGEGGGADVASAVPCLTDEQKNGPGVTCVSVPKSYDDRTLCFTRSGVCYLSATDPATVPAACWSDHLVCLP